MPNSTILLIGRILLAAIFIVSGFGKLTGIAGFAGYLGSMGLPAPTLLAWLVMVLELGGGILILIGFLTAPIAYALAAFCVVSALLAHTNFADQTQMNMFLKNIAIAGGFLVLAASGPGSISVERRKTA